MKLVVLGGGAQGRVIAADLARARPADHVTVADLAPPALPALPNLSAVAADLSHPNALARLLHDHDVAVGALPSRIGFRALEAAIDARRTMVDVSFSAEDPLTLDAPARRAGVTLAPDCGLAPGISHLVAGRLVAERGTPEWLTILVGGVAEDRTAPYGYVVTWSLDDLLEEYVRPARVVRGGRVVERPAFDELERVTVEGVGEMEAFLSDGLRTLLTTLPGVPTMSEKTLRWPGHVDAVRPLVASGRLQEELRRRCTADPPRDQVVLSVRIGWRENQADVGFVDRYDPRSGLTAMARTTALTTSAVAQLAAEGGLTEPGVQPLERVGRDARAYAFLLERLGAHGVRLREAWNAGSPGRADTR